MALPLLVLLVLPVLLVLLQLWLLRRILRSVCVFVADVGGGGPIATMLEAGWHSRRSSGRSLSDRVHG